MLQISNNVAIPLDEIEMSAVRSQGAGGQNVNKVSTAVHLRFDIEASSLPSSYKERLLRLKDRRITKEGVIVIKSQQYRTQEKNKEDALQRLQELIERAMVVPRKRKATRATFSSRQQRLDSKNKRSRQKSLRQKIKRWD